MPWRPTLLVIPGQVVNSLTVLRETTLPRELHAPLRSAICRCACGAEVTVELTVLLSGRRKSCGCMTGRSRRKGRMGEWGRECTGCWLSKTWAEFSPGYARCRECRRREQRQLGDDGLKSESGLSMQHVSGLQPVPRTDSDPSATESAGVSNYPCVTTENCLNLRESLVKYFDSLVSRCEDTLMD